MNNGFVDSKLYIHKYVLPRYVFSLLTLRPVKQHLAQMMDTLQSTTQVIGMIYIFDHGRKTLIFQQPQNTHWLFIFIFSKRRQKQIDVQSIGERNRIHSIVPLSLHLVWKIFQCMHFIQCKYYIQLYKNIFEINFKYHKNLYHTTHFFVVLGSKKKVLVLDESR